MGETGLIYHPDYLLHDTGAGHPERPDRLKAVMAHLEEVGLMSRLKVVQPGPPRADLASWIARAHHPTHLNYLKELHDDDGLVRIDSDTVMTPRSLPAALLAVEGMLAAADGIMSGRFRHAFCAVRPPGHHAEAERAMGFCLLNNVAVAARYLQKRYGLAKIMIIDWDVHHATTFSHYCD